MKFKLLPCAPCDLERVEAWINDEQKNGLRLKRFGVLLPFLAFFASGNGDEEYSISLERPDDDGPERVCVLRNVGYVVKGEPSGEFDESTLKAASSRVGRGFIMFVFPYVLIMGFGRMLVSGGGFGAILLAGFAACFLALIGAGLYFLLTYDPAKSPRARGLALYILGTTAIWVWVILLVIRLIAAMP